MESVHSKCIVCATDFEIQPGNSDKNTRVIFQRIWNSFLSHFNLCPSTWKDLFDYYIQLNEVPFCLTCRNNVANIFVLEDKVNKIKSQISKEVATISLKIIESLSNLPSHTLPSGQNGSSNFDCDSGRGVESIDPLHTNSNEIVTKKIDALRNKIFQDWNPHVRLEDCQNKLKKDSQLFRKVTPTIAKVEPFINQHFSNSPDDEICKHESEYLQLMQDYCNSEPIKFEQIKTEQHTEINTELNDDDDPLYFPPSSPRSPRRKRKVIKRRIHEDATHNCELCQKTFSRNFNLLRHNVVVHQKKRMPKKKTLKKNFVKLVSLGDDRFDYGGFVYEKKEDGKYYCTCGAIRSAELTMKAHIRYDHIKKTPVSIKYDQKHKKTYGVQIEQSKQNKRKIGLPGSVIKNIGNGEYVYQGTLKFRKISEQDYECSTCSKHAFRYRAMYGHIKTVHDPESCPYLCKTCNIGFETKERFMRHRRGHELRRWVAGPVPGSFIYDGKFEFDRVEDGYECGECGVIRKQLYSLTKHIKWNHASVESQSCPKCFMKFKERDAFVKHMAKTRCEKTRWTHLDPKNLLLDEKWPVEIFEITDDKGQTFQRFKCSTCGQERAKKCGLIRHIDERHINPGAFPCSKCSKAFNTPYDLKLHDTRVHVDEGSFACDVPGCQGTFKLKRQLVTHRQACIKNYFVTGKGLVGSVPVPPPMFMCSYCGLTYSTKEKMDAHLTIPVEDIGKIFKCSVCGQIYPTAMCFRYHSFIKHTPCP